ncbi:hypothetical protein J7E81_24885 [Bacillus sp. ISL-18]|nr:hypothetical protein [Bacillus sp. ISL-18]
MYENDFTINETLCQVEIWSKLTGSPRTRPIHLYINSRYISHDSDVEILIPDLHLATLEENVHFRMRLTAKRGHGYVPPEQNKRDGLQVGVFIPIDSIYTPVTRANYLVESIPHEAFEPFLRNEGCPRLFKYCHFSELTDVTFHGSGTTIKAYLAAKYC